MMLFKSEPVEKSVIYCADSSPDSIAKANEILEKQKRTNPNAQTEIYLQKIPAFDIEVKEFNHEFQPSSLSREKPTVYSIIEQDFWGSEITKYYFHGKINSGTDWKSNEISQLEFDRLNSFTDQDKIIPKVKKGKFCDSVLRDFSHKVVANGWHNISNTDFIQKNDLEVAVRSITCVMSPLSINHSEIVPTINQYERNKVIFVHTSGVNVTKEDVLNVNTIIGKLTITKDKYSLVLSQEKYNDLLSYLKKIRNEKLPRSNFNDDVIWGLDWIPFVLEIFSSIANTGYELGVSFCVGILWMMGCTLITNNMLYDAADNLYQMMTNKDFKAGYNVNNDVVFNINGEFKDKMDEFGGKDLILTSIAYSKANPTELNCKIETEAHTAIKPVNKKPIPEVSSRN